MVETIRPDIVLSFFAGESEFVRPIRGVRRIVDDCDSRTLALERFMRSEKIEHFSRRLTYIVYRGRVKAGEKRLAADFDLVTAVSPADRDRLAALSPRHAQRIVVAPNGVAPELLSNRETAEEIPDSIILWGNMGFQPNRSAVLYFFRHVYLPFLAERNVHWYIAGGGADDDIVEMGKRHPNITVTGFVEDLFGLAARIPVMINPMVLGSGLKNKILEAFALKRAVVSTPLGMEAIQGAEDGVHYRAADTPEDFANAVLECLAGERMRRQMGERARRLVEERYTWEAVGRLWHGWIDQMLEGKSPIT
jgi:glycosyltransferase involved in cell wall biosynthesis